QGKITDVNKATEEATGVPRERLIGSDFTDYFTEPDKAQEGYQQVIDRGLVRDYPLTMRHVSGHTMDVLYNATVYRNEAGELQGVFAAARDVTERKRAEEALQRANVELEQRAAQLRILAAELTQAEQRERRRLAQMLHDDLQQLLAAAKLRVGAVQLRGGKANQDVLQRISELLDQSVQLTRSLTVELSPPVIDLGLAAALHWLEDWMQEKHGLTVEIDADERVHVASEDVRMFLFQAVRELLFNVVKHAGIRHATVEVAPTPDQQVRVVVADQGIGFDPTQRQHDKTLSGGYGVFSIQERLVALGGRLEIESAPGVGTRIVLYAPLSKAVHVDKALPGQAQGVSAIRVPAVNGNRIRVLLADDRQIVREGIASLLRGQPNIEVVGEASDGQTAVELARQLKPDVVIMDVTMPKLDGIAATRRILAECAQVRVIGLSMHQEADVALAMREAGAVACLTKDGASKVLVNTIYTSLRPAG
ncbi:MAG: response regulator, partial [Chloroflexi bacterium]|nr:response regulator [Chloroflexota bacterium]